MDDITTVSILPIHRLSSSETFISQVANSTFSWIHFKILIDSLDLSQEDHSILLVESFGSIHDKSKDSTQNRSILYICPLIRLAGQDVYDSINQTHNLVRFAIPELLQVKLSNSAFNPAKDNSIGVSITQNVGMSKKQICMDIVQPYEYIKIDHNKLNIHWEVEVCFMVLVDGRERHLQTGWEFIRWRTNSHNRNKALSPDGLDGVRVQKRKRFAEEETKEEDQVEKKQRVSRK